MIAGGDESEMKDAVKAAFEKKYGNSLTAVCSFAPGRVNLIGEHTDYNGGHVFPCALTLGTYIVGRKRDDEKLRFCSLNHNSDEIVESELIDMHPLNDRSWTAYMKGVIWALAEQGMNLPCGFDVLVGGDIPAGAGLSSSASLEVATGNLLRELYGFDLDNKDLALIGKRAENDYVGMNCGIMDQFASAMGRKDHAIYLDTASLDYRYVPLDLKNKLIVITNTNKPHELASSAYNDRRRECGEALDILKKECGLKGKTIKELGDLTAEEFDSVKSVLTDDVLLRRARHAVYENERTLKAVSALENNDIVTFGKLMNDSHASLRDDYEVSCRELDVLAETAQNIKGVYGSRMTGGGFGGCTVSIIEKESLDSFKRIVSEEYRKAIGYDCSFYTVIAGGGPHIE